MNKFTHGSLFSGIGGFDLAAEWMGWQNEFHCEINPFCKQLLKYYWPHAQSFDDIKTADFSIFNGLINVLTGGFPCQPYSSAGKRKGKDDERHLWPYMLRAIRAIQPRWVVGENVRGLINWNGGLVFDEVQADLEAAGYEVFPFLLPAAGVNAPHERYRIWFVAHSNSFRQQRGGGQDEKYANQSGQQTFCRVDDGYANGVVADTESIQNIRGRPFGFQPKFTGVDDERVITNASSKRSGESLAREQSKQPNENGKERGINTNTDNEGLEVKQRVRKNNEQERQAFKRNNYRWENWPTQSPVCNGDDGLSGRLDFATVFGSIKHPRKPARAFGKWRNETIKGGGNAIVPKLVYEIFKTIEAYERLTA